MHNMNNSHIVTEGAYDDNYSQCVGEGWGVHNTNLTAGCVCSSMTSYIHARGRMRIIGRKRALYIHTNVHRQALTQQESTTIGGTQIKKV